MRTVALVILSLAIPSVLAAQSGQFIVRLGTDTLAIEQYTRTPDRLQGEQVLRSPRTVHRLYSATFGPGGAIARFELVTHNVSGAPGPAETKATAEFTGDSAVVTVPRRDSTVTLRVNAGPGAVPFIGQGFGLIEEVARRAKASRSARYTTTMLPLGDTVPLEVTVSARGPDSLTLVLGAIGPLRAHVDAQGALLGLSGIGSTMQRSEEHTSELQSRSDLVCRLLLEKKNDMGTDAGLALRKTWPAPLAIRFSIRTPRGGVWMVCSWLRVALPRVERFAPPPVGMLYMC